MDLRARVRLVHRDIEERVLAVGGAAARLLDEEGHRDRLVQQPQPRSLVRLSSGQVQ